MNTKVKVLVIRFSSIGDIVLTSPIVRCLKSQLEGDVEVHFITKESFSSILECNPNISKVYTINKSTNEVIGDLQKEQYDYVIDLHKNLRSSRIKRKLDALSFDFDKANFEKWLIVNFKINRLPKIHIVDRYFNGIRALGINNDGEGLDFFIPKEVEENFKLPFKDYICLVLGANHATKQVPLLKLQEILRNINKNVVLLGGKNEEKLGETLKELNPQTIYNASGKTTIHESAVLIKMAESIITPDTGMMHIAAAFQKKIVTIWGNTIPAFGMYPYLKKGDNRNYIALENNHLNCRPCSKIGFDKCPKKHFKCMKEQDLTSISDYL